MSLTNPSALILLSTYNGRAYLEAQLKSIIGQTFTNWKLLIRDDGSTEGVDDVLDQFVRQDARIMILRDQHGNLRVKNSFSALMAAALKRHEDFIFFCDQDDVWLPDKLSETIAVIMQMQEQDGEQTPLLVHSDLHVVDSNLSFLHPSFLDFEKLNRNLDFPLRTLLINNYVTGCTMAMNRALLALSCPVPDVAFMHDWWCALCAAAMGQIGFINKSTILYRQHADNQLGSRGFYHKMRELLKFEKRKNKFAVCFDQAKILLDRMDKNHANYSLIRDFSSLKHKNLISRYRLAKKLNLQAASKIRHIYFWCMLMSLHS